MFLVGMVTALTANGAKGVVSNVPYITDLANFTNSTLTQYL